MNAMRVVLDRFENAIRLRNPNVAKALQFGLSEDIIVKALRDNDVKGAIQPIVCYFSWRNGCQYDSSMTLGEISPFPESIYGFLDLKTALEHFGLMHAALVYHPKYDETDGRYFPLFWDNANSWIALDLDHNQHSRIVLLITESEILVHEAYQTFEEFIQDATYANMKNEPLTCFGRL